MDKPSYLRHGEPARLIPALSETNRELRVTSVFLALLTQIPGLAGNFLRHAGVRLGVRKNIRTYTEVVLATDQEKNDRPDGLIVVTTGKKSWSALVETKIGGQDIDVTQVERYLKLARANGIDALITISNEFVVNPQHSPVSVSKGLLNRVSLYHWSWIAIMTECEILLQQEGADSPVQEWLLEELHRFLHHPKTGVERFTSMGQGWKGLVQSVANGEHLRESSEEVAEAVSSWFSEERDLTLQLGRLLGEHVHPVLSRSHDGNPALRAKDASSQLAKRHKLVFVFRITAAASNLEVTADLARRTISASMTLKANQERKTAKARILWLARMLKEDDDRLQIRAHWPGRTPPTQARLTDVRKEPERLLPENSSQPPNRFEVLLIENIGTRRFVGRRNFIEDLERIVPDFYNLAGQHLRNWEPSPPKPRAKKGQRAEMGAQGIDDSTEPAEPVAEVPFPGPEAAVAVPVSELEDQQKDDGPTEQSHTTDEDGWPDTPPEDTDVTIGYRSGESRQQDSYTEQEE